MKIRRYRIWLGVALGHLTLVTLGAFEFDFSRFGRVGRLLTYYGEVTGSGDSYGFFAPGIFDQLRARYEYTDGAGVTRSAALETHVSHEADLRVGNIIDQFQNDEDKDNAADVQRSIAASLAGTVFGRHPEARTVNVLLERYVPVSMPEYRAGKRSVWESLYSAKFAYSPRAKGDDAH